MTKLLEFRAKYPQYDNVSDEVLADKLHKKYYNDVPFDVFADKIGLRESGILAALKGGTERFISSGQTALESLIGSPEEAGIEGARRQQEISERIAPGADLDKVKQVYEKEGLLSAAGEAVGQIPEAVAEMAPAMGATLASGAAGAGLGTAIAGPPGGVIGGIAGAFFPSLITRAGTNIEQQAAAQQAEGQPVDINRAAAFGTAIPQAAIDTLANALPVMGKAAVAKVLGPAVERALARGSVADAERIARESLIKRAGKGIGENLAVQGLAQPTQVMLTRLQAGQDLLSDEALSEYGHALYMAGLISPIGAVGGIRERGQARQELTARDARLDVARQTLAEKIDAEKPAPDAPDPSMSAANVQRLLGVNLSEAKEIRRALSERGDLVPGTEKGEAYKLYLNRDRIVKPIEEATVAEEAAAPAAATAPDQAITGEQLLGTFTERSPEEIAAAEAAAKAEVEAATVEPTLRPKKEKEPAKLKLTSPESPVYQNTLSVLETLHTTNTPITPVTFREAIKELGVKPIHAEPLLNAFTRDGVLSKPDENKVRTFSREAVEGVKPFETALTQEVANELVSTESAKPDLEPTGRGVEPPVSGDRTEVGTTEVGVPGRVGDVSEPARVGAISERPGEPALGEPVPYSAQPIAPDVFVPSPEQARISTEAIDTGLVPGRGIERAKRILERQKEEQRQKEETVPVPEEGVSQRYDSVAESLRAGNLGEALYRLREESSGKSPLSWLADKLLNVTNIKDDRSAIIKAETERVARAVRVDKREDPDNYAKIAKQVERAIMSDVDLTKYDFTDAEGRLTEAGRLRAEFTPEVERMVPVKKGLAQYDRETGRLEFIRPAPEPKKPENLYRPYVLETPKAESPFKKGAFGGAKVFVEGNEGIKGQNKAVIERLKKEGKLAEYNPKTNTFYFTEAGLTDRVILHEMVHSATVDVMKKFESGKLEDLTAVQRDAAADIMSIYESTKKALGEKFKNAYESPYEFVSYAMTNEGFQRALSYLNAPKTTRMKLRSAWDSFTLAVAKMFGLDKAGRLKAMEEPSPTRELKPGEGIKRALGMERAEAADTFDNALLQVLDSVSNILTVPKAGVDVEPLAARRSGRFARRRRDTTPKQINTPPTQPLGSTQGTFITPNSKLGVRGSIKRIVESKWFDKLVFNLQNYKRGFAVLQEAMDRAGLTRRGGEDATDVYDKLTVATGKQEINENRRVTPLINSLSEAITGYAKKIGKSNDEAAEHIGTLRMALNELEKRTVKFLLHVPLNDKPILVLGGKPISPAAYRDAMIDYLIQNKDLVSNGEAKRIRAQLEKLVQKYAELGGKSRDNRVPSSSPDALDINAKHYQVVGYDNAKLNAWRRVYAREMRKYGPEMKAVFDAIDAINTERIAMEREGKFWTQQVDNLKEFYGYGNYVPFKGMDTGTADLSFDLSSTVRAGRQYQQLEDRAMGRTTEINNPILQIVQDLHKASVRSSTDGVTQSIVNILNEPKPFIEGKLVDKVSFADKFNGKQKEDLSKYNVFFHNLPDGSTEVYALKSKRLIDGLNGFNTELGAVTRNLGKFTNFMGKMHTFYNLGFAPFNFLRDTLTNAYNASGRFGITAAPKIIGAVAKNMLESGLFYRAAKISLLYAKGNMNAIKNMKGEFAKNAYEFLSEGGRGTYKSVFSMGEIQKTTLGPKRIVSKENVDKIFNTWADMFEFVSRASTYGVVKKSLIAEAKAKGKNTNDPVFIKGVREQAAAYTKNLFNYEQVGKYGRQIGSYYMFMRPSLTSAVRVMDVFRPLFETAESAMERGPSLLKITDPADPNYARAQAARTAYAESFTKEKVNAFLLSALIGGMGAVAYNMARQASDTDDRGRNKVDTDDPAMWTRFLRFPMKFAGEGNEFLQIPWGFGPGAFAAMGAQFAIWANGNQTLGELGENMIPIVMDSFLPLPVPRFSPVDEPNKFILDSVLPSSIRPMLEYAVNMDGLGREIYTDRLNKYGDAYSAGENIPKVIRDFTSEVMNMTAGWDKPLEIDPKSVNYYVNTYLDAIGKFASAIHGLSNIASGEKNFDIKADMPLVGSFVGKKSSIDARKFSDLRTEIEQKKQFLSAYRNRPQFQEYLRAHPQDLALVSLYDNTINGRLKEIQSVMNKVNSEVGVYAGLSPGAKQRFLRKLRAEKEFLMGNFVKIAEAIKSQADED